MTERNAAMMGTTLAVTQTVALWSTLMEPLSQIHRCNYDTDNPFVADVRQDELVAAVLALTIGAVMSRIEGSWIPFVATSFLVGTLIVAYEYTLRKPGHSAPLVTVTERINRNG